MSSQVSQDAFRSIFPKYCDLLAEGMNDFTQKIQGWTEGRAFYDQAELPLITPQLQKA